MDYKVASQEFKELLSKYRRVSIVSHKRPDGDTVSSALALYSLLKREGFSCEVVCSDDDLPIKFNFLNGFNRYKKRVEYDDSLVVVVDCAEIGRTGLELEGREIVNIDHHKSNTFFGALNVVELEASATSVLYKLIKEGFRLDKDIATAIYAGLLSDSINFTTSLTSKESFKIASELLDYGVDLNFVSNRVNRFKSLAHIRVLSRAIDSMQLYLDGKVAIMVILKEDIEATGAKYSDINGVIDSAVSLATIEVAILLIEMKDFIKGSFRSKNVDISDMAMALGGGGHKNAAAFEVKNGKISEVKEKILRELKGL